MTYVIAEIGVNHNGDIKIAKQLINEAKRAGADAAKFQIFITEDIVSPDAPKAKYQVDNGSSGKTQYEMLKSLELSFTDAKKLKDHCEKTGIDFMSSVFGIRELNFYVDKLKCKTVKFGSGELTNAPMILAAARKRIKIILSTGMADLSDIEFALGVVAYGYVASKKGTPTPAAFRKAFKSKAGQAALKKNVLIMQCTTQYPCPDSAINLQAMVTIKNRFKLDVGFSDHSDGFGLASASVALGAKMIEKHFTLDKNMEGPDHKASLNIQQFSEYVKAIRSVEKGLGDGRKTISAAAKKIAGIACKKIVADKEIIKGELFSEKNLTTRRTGDKGLRDMYYYDLIGKKAKKSYKAGEVIKL